MFGAMLLEAWAAIGANRLRSLLTMLGMVIGVAAVILMLALGRGAQFTVEQGIASMGSNLFMILSGAPTQGGVRGGTGGAPTLTLADNDAILDTPGIITSAPLSMGNSQLVYGANNWSTQVFGTTPSYLDVRSWNLSDGIPFTDADLRSASRVVLLGQTVVKNLFDTENPVGKTIRIKGSPYTVIGVLGVKGQSLDGRDQDDTALIPVTTANRKLFGGQFPNSVRVIMAQAESAQSMPKVENRLNELLHQRHHIGQGQDDDFSVRNLSALVETAASATKVLSLLLGGIASISLLVGGIGIMNIMLVSVTERTREIGIRAAIGARRRDIMLQFLAESVIISVFGCFIGVVLGVSGAWLVQQATDMTVVVTGFSILMSFGVAASVGIFFGFYPARKASLLKPIDALRQ